MIIGVGVGIFDFANLILFCRWLDGLSMEIRLLRWFLFSDMLVLFGNWIHWSPLESALRLVLYGKVLFKVDCFFGICREGAGVGFFGWLYVQIHIRNCTYWSTSKKKFATYVEFYISS